MIINAENEKKPHKLLIHSLPTNSTSPKSFLCIFIGPKPMFFPFEEGKSRRKAREKSSGGGGEVRMDESAEMDDKSTNI
jgi:hypothetical protein